MRDFFLNPLFNKIFFREKTFYAEYINNEILNCAQYLQTLSESSSPFIFIKAHNHIKTIIAYFAIIKAGYIAVIINPYLGKLELQELIDDAYPHAIIDIDNDSLTFSYKEEILRLPESKAPPPNENIENVCTMVYTNAEDGFMKGVKLTYQNLYTAALTTSSGTLFSSSSVICGIIPFSHLFCFTICILAPLTIGASILIQEPEDVQKIQKITNEIEKYRVTHLYSVPGVFYFMCKIKNIRSIFKNVKYLTSGGYKLPKFIYEKFKAKSGFDIREGYGLTEASPVCTWHHPKDKVKIDSVGTPIKCCEIKIMDKNMNECKIGEEGEICIKGDNVMLGYYKKPEETKKVLKKGWLLTGDLGKTDEEGYIYFTGLKKKMFNVAGKNVYPEEVIRLTESNPQIEYAEMSGIQNDIQGHKITLHVKLKNDSKENREIFKEWCKSNIINYKIPKIIFKIGINNYTKCIHGEDGNSGHR